MPIATEDRKDLGAYYTPERVADFLTNWAIRSSRDSVMDPSAGGGVFLASACRRLQSLGGRDAGKVLGIERSSDAYEQTKRAMAAAFGPGCRLVHGDFFDQDPVALGEVTAIIGNPPFIRFQRFSGDDRRKALSRAAEAGVVLSELSSSWAPFLVHATRFIKSGGRMAVVAPAEIAYASYAQPVVRFLVGSFARIQLLVFERKLFPDISEDTVLILAEGRGQLGGALSLHKLEGPESLVESETERPFDPGEAGQAAHGWTSGVARLIEYMLPQASRELYREISTSGSVFRLGDVADVGIGYVTGNNTFFHLSASRAKQLGIHGRYLARAVRNARNVSGLRFSLGDWKARRDQGDENSLLRIKSTATIDSHLQRYLISGTRAGVHSAYKCRTRDPWYSVPHVHVGDAFLTYMSGTRTKMFSNDAGAVAPNTLHVVRCRTTNCSGSDLAVAWQSALTELSCEIEGHSLGGGMLKLEPRESGRVLVPHIPDARGAAIELDALSRRHDAASVSDVVDAAAAAAIGLSKSDTRRLREAARLLRERRTRR